MAVTSLPGLALSLLVPPRCSLCGEAAPAASSICSACRAALASAPAGSSVNERQSAFEYSGAAAAAVRALKFTGRPALAVTMAELIRERLPADWLAGAILVPVPAHPARQRERGFNQSSLIARALARPLGLPVCDCLRRDAGSAPQSSLSRAQRLAMKQGSISVRPRAYRQLLQQTSAEFPTNVLMCDDVVTTGVTLEVCAAVLREGHPDPTVRIRAVTFASTSAQFPKHTGHG